MLTAIPEVPVPSAPPGVPPALPGTAEGCGPPSVEHGGEERSPAEPPGAAAGGGLGKGAYGPREERGILSQAAPASGVPEGPCVVSCMITEGGLNGVWFSNVILSCAFAPL